MPPHGRVLLVERVIQGGTPLALLTLESDLNMLVTQNGRERTATEYRALFSAAGLTLTHLVPVLPTHHLIEAGIGE